jgi:xanthine/CO dehydrogenase XdhC/CoxF family maturation factor
MMSPVKPWQFFLLSIVMFGVAILGLRHNDMTSQDMKARIIKRDLAGKSVQQEREELKRFVYNHMNASRRIELRGAYERAQARARVEADNSVDGSVYDQAQAACDRQGQRTRENANCVQNYIQQRLEDSSAGVDMPDKGNFVYEYRSPIWTTDIPGVAIALGILSLLTGSVLYIKHSIQKLVGKKNGSR